MSIYIFKANRNSCFFKLVELLYNPSTRRWQLQKYSLGTTALLHLNRIESIFSYSPLSSVASTPLFPLVIRSWITQFKTSTTLVTLQFFSMKKRDHLAAYVGVLAAHQVSPPKLRVPLISNSLILYIHLLLISLM